MIKKKYRENARNKQYYFPSPGLVPRRQMVEREKALKGVDLDDKKIGHFKLVLCDFSQFSNFKSPQWRFSRLMSSSRYWSQNSWHPFLLFSFLFPSLLTTGCKFTFKMSSTNGRCRSHSVPYIARISFQEFQSQSHGIEQKFIDWRYTRNTDLYISRDQFTPHLYM